MPRRFSDSAAARQDVIVRALRSVSGRDVRAEEPAAAVLNRWEQEGLFVSPVPNADILPLLLKVPIYSSMLSPKKDFLSDATTENPGTIFILWDKNYRGAKALFLGAFLESEAEVKLWIDRLVIPAVFVIPYQHGFKVLSPLDATLKQ